MDEQTLVICGESALAAIRCHRRRYARLNWDPLPAAELRHVLAACAPSVNTIDWDALAISGVWEEGAKLHVLTSRSCRWRAADNLVIHSAGQTLPSGSIMRISRGIYVTSPLLTCIMLANSLSYGRLRGLLEEMAGCISLTEGESYCASEAALAAAELRASISRYRGLNGQRAVADCARYVIGGARSPMEAIMYGMFSSPLNRGGFACSDGEPNVKVSFNRDAVLVSNIPYAICDLLFRKAGITLEYNGAYHASDDARKHDERRTAGLAAMGIATVPINDGMLANLDALTAIAKLLYKKSGRRFRVRQQDYGKLQPKLLNGLRSWYSLDPV